MKLKKALAALFSLLFVFLTSLTLISCGGNDSNSTSTTPSTGAPSTTPSTGTGDVNTGTGTGNTGTGTGTGDVNTGTGDVNTGTGTENTGTGTGTDDVNTGTGDVNTGTGTENTGTGTGTDVDEDLEIVLTVIENLTVELEVTEDFTLKTTDVGGVKISWTSNNPEVIEIVGGNATVTRPESGDVQVKLTATVTLNDAEQTTDFEVTVKQAVDTSKPIADVINAADGTTVEVRGVVSGVVKKYASDLFSVYGYWVTDETGTIYVYGASEVQKGNLVQVKGVKKLDTYNEAKGVVIHEITNPEVTVLKETEELPEFAGAIDTTLGELLAMEKGCAGNVYKFMANVAVNVNTGSNYTNFQLKDGNLSIGEYVSGSLTASATYESEFADYYTNKDKKMVVYFAVQGKTGSGKWRGTALAMVEPTDADNAVSQAKLALNSVADEFYAVADVDLPTGVTFSVSENDYCSVVEGKLKVTALPAKDQSITVKLTATATVNNVSKSATKDIVITGNAEKDITSLVTIENSMITIPYDVMEENRVYVIKVDETTTVKIAASNISVNAGYKELMIGKAGGSLLVTVEGDKKLTSLVSDVYGSYDNMKFYVGSDATGTAVTATSTTTGATNGKVYTYLCGTADAVYFVNPDASHDVGLFNLYLTVGTEPLTPEVTEADITSSVTIVDGKVTIPYNAIVSDGTFTIQYDANNVITIVASGVNVNDNFKELMVAGKGQLLISIAGTSKLTSLIGDVFGTYDNMKFYVGNDATGTAVTATSTATGATNGKVYTYLCGTAEAVCFANPSTYNVGFFNISLTVGTESLGTEPTPTPDPEPTPEPLPEGVYAQCSFDKKTIIGDFTYITNNPAYPEPGWNKVNGVENALKLNFEGQGVKSPTFAAVDSCVVTINIHALNKNTKTEAQSTDVFTIKGYNEAGEVVDTKTLTTVTVGENNKVTLVGTGIVFVEVIMTGYFKDASGFYNIALLGVTVSKAE